MSTPIDATVPTDNPSANSASAGAAATNAQVGTPVKFPPFPPPPSGVKILPFGSTLIDVTVTTGNPAVDSAPAVAAATDTPADAAPWIKFPPFPTPPPGVKIKSFKSFQPGGITVVADPPPGYVELDSQKIPTVQLLAKHDLTAMEQKKRRTPKTKTGADGSVRKLTWWEQWEADEPMRRTSAPIDQSISRVDRLHQASQEFKANRSWPAVASGVPQLWDAFRLYIGIISSIQPSIGRKRMQQMQAMQTAMEEESEDEEEDVNGKPKERQVVMVNEEQAKVIEGQQQSYPPRRTDLSEEERQLRKEYFREERDSRMDAFFDDTEKNIKIFLSSYFRDKGLIWSEQRVRDAPILIGFFINFIIRSRILPEHEKGLRRALSVTELARNELPATFVIGKALPDDFSAGCEALFGNMSVLVDPGVFKPREEAEDPTGERDAKRQKLDDAEQSKDPEEVLKEMVGVHNIEVITGEQIKDLEKEVHKERQAADANVNGSETGGWSSNGGGWVSADNTASDSWGNAGSTDQGGDWTTIDVDDGDWQTAGSTWDNGPTPNQLMAFLGPTVLPLTHTAGVIERSTRRILSVTPAPDRSKLPKKKAKRSGAEKVEDELEGRFARLVLAPWASGPLAQHTDVFKPEILPPSRGLVVEDVSKDATVASGASRPHNPFKDEITVLLDPSVADKMIVGMGLSATWVQLARQDLSGVDWMDEKSADEPKPGSVAGKVGVPTSFWYMEKLLSILPSYHSEA